MAGYPKALQIFASRGYRIQTYSKTYRCAFYTCKNYSWKVHLVSSSGLALTNVSCTSRPMGVGLSFHLEDKGVKADASSSSVVLSQFLPQIASHVCESGPGTWTVPPCSIHESLSNGPRCPLPSQVHPPSGPGLIRR